MKKITAILTSLIMTLSVICQTSVFAAFSDVGDDNTYKDAITTLTKLKVIDGYEDGTFKPDGRITRAEIHKAYRIYTWLQRPCIRLIRLY